MARIFLCHASEDKPQVREVYQRLKAQGFEPWLDEEEILPGQDWDYEIEVALETSDFVLVFLSTRSVGKTGYVQREFRRALYHSEEIPEGQIHTIPVKLDDCEVPRRFIRHQWANLNDDGAFDRIVRALHLGLEQRGQPVPAPPAPEPEEPVSSSKAEPMPGRSSTRVIKTPPVARAEARVEMPEAFSNDLGMTFVRIAPGTFWMGTSAEEVEGLIQRYPGVPRDWLEPESPRHQVTISKPYYLGIHPVTQEQWEAVMGDNPSQFQGDAHCPVEQVSWDDVQAFLERLSARDGRTYRLPSEAQWEYACRAGSTGAYCFGDDVGELGNYAWYDENSGYTTHPVGQKQANAWGLYDMHGNVCEWVQDWFGDYPADAVTDPSGPAAGAPRVLRGGGWGSSARSVRSAFRSWFFPGLLDDYVGFRCLSAVKSGAME